MPTHSCTPRIHSHTFTLAHLHTSTLPHMHTHTNAGSHSHTHSHKHTHTHTPTHMDIYRAHVHINMHCEMIHKVGDQHSCRNRIGIGIMVVNEEQTR